MSVETREAGIAKSEASAEPEWEADVYRRIVEVNNSLEFFTSDDIWTDHLKASAKKLSHLGPLVQGGSKAGLYDKVCGGYMSDLSNHSGLSVWRSRRCRDGSGVEVFSNPGVLAEMVAGEIRSMLKTDPNLELERASFTAALKVLDLLDEYRAGR